MAEEFIGAGWAFPLRADSTGGVALVSGDQELEEAIRLVLGTAPGERPMRPEFGCAMHEFVFAPADATTAGRIAYEVRLALDRWEPRIEVIDVEVTTDEPAADGRGLGGSGSGTLYIDIRYVRRGSNDPRNLVFPFYVIESEG